MRMARWSNEYTTVFNCDLGTMEWCRLCDRVSRSEGGLILIMLFRILKNVIACLIIRLRSRVCQLTVSTRLVGLVVLL